MGRDTAEQDCMRADKWLWAARFYKTRPLATAAINGGVVHVNGERVKPAKPLSPGDALTIQKGPYTFSIVVLKLARQRRPAVEARTLYTESEESQLKRHALYEQNKLEGQCTGPMSRRPDKKTRRLIHRFKQQEN
jgi:ribosome-associated heat shock protein Hsp15